MAAVCCAVLLPRLGPLGAEAVRAREESISTLEAELGQRFHAVERPFGSVHPPRAQTAMTMFQDVPGAKLATEQDVQDQVLELRRVMGTILHQTQLHTQFEAQLQHVCSLSQLQTPEALQYLAWAFKDLVVSLSGTSIPGVRRDAGVQLAATSMNESGPWRAFQLAQHLLLQASWLFTKLEQWQRKMLFFSSFAYTANSSSINNDFAANQGPTGELGKILLDALSELPAITGPFTFYRGLSSVNGLHDFAQMSFTSMSTDPRIALDFGTSGCVWVIHIREGESLRLWNPSFVAQKSEDEFIAGPAQFGRTAEPVEFKTSLFTVPLYEYELKKSLVPSSRRPPAAEQLNTKAAGQHVQPAALAAQPLVVAGHASPVPMEVDS